MWLASKFYNKCALLNISVSMSQRQLIWCVITLVSLLKMSKYRLHSSFFFPVEEIGNSNKFLCYMQAAGQICFLTLRRVVKWLYPWGTRSGVLWVSSDWSPLFTKRLRGRVPMKSRESTKGKPGKPLCSEEGSAYTVLLCPSLCWANDRHSVLADRWMLNES